MIKIKRIWAALLVLCMLMTLAPVSVFAQTAGGICGENVNWSYDFDTGHLSISGTGNIRPYTESSLPPWYRFSDDIVSLNIESGVTGIGDYAFYWCNKITSVTIPNSVVSIGSNAFYHCDALTSINIPSGVQSIGKDAFMYCDALTSVTIPGSVTSIGEGAFSSCDSLTSATIQSGVKNIGKEAFYWCGQLGNITLPDSVTGIGVNAFYLTPYYDSSIPDWDELYIGNHFIAANQNISGDYTIKAGTKTIADCAFSHCDKLTSITIPDSVASIGNRAFDSCNGLTAVTIPKSVKSIGDYAFQVCFDLTSINVAADNTAYCSKNGVLYDKEKTEIIRFPKEKADTQFKIPESVTTIADGAFENCSKLTGITIPSGVNYIGSDAFNGCSALTGIEIPEGVANIGDKTFFDCEKLKSVTIPNSVVSIGENAFKSDSSKLKEVLCYKTPEEWQTVTVKSGNRNLTNAEIKYMPFTKSTSVQKSDGNLYVTVSAKNCAAGKKIIAVGYTEDKISGAEVSDCNGEDKSFIFSGNTDKIIIYVWESNIAPYAQKPEKLLKSDFKSSAK